MAFSWAQLWEMLLLSLKQDFLVPLHNMGLSCGKILLPESSHTPLGRILSLVPAQHGFLGPSPPDFVGEDLRILWERL